MLAEKPPTFRNGLHLTYLAEPVTAKGHVTDGCLFPPGARLAHMGLSLVLVLGTEMTHLRQRSGKLPIWQDGPLTYLPFKPRAQVQKAGASSILHLPSGPQHSQGGRRGPEPLSPKSSCSWGPGV